LQRVDQAQSSALQEATQGLKDELRQETAAVLGTRVSLTWRSRFYPNRGDSRGPAGFVWSKAPRIIDFWSAQRVVTPLGQAFAIPGEPGHQAPRPQGDDRRSRAAIWQAAGRSPERRQHRAVRDAAALEERQRLPRTDQGPRARVEAPNGC
jgi:hypothetical protein